MRPRIYLAGPEVFLPDPAAAAARLQRLCAGHGLDGVFPLDQAVAPRRGEPPAGHAARIRAANLDLIRGADMVLANVTPFRGPSPDDGTVYEMGFAAALGRPVFAYSDDPRALLERTRALMPVTERNGVWRDDAGMMVEEFGLPVNLMLVDPATGGVHAGAETAIRAAAAWWAGRRGAAVG